MGKVPSHGYDWFALGGVIFREADEQEIRDLHEKFCSNWDIDFPLHSSEIRAKANKFSFIGRLSKEDELRFYEELYQMMRSMPVLGTACVIDRPCYNDRYLEKYDPSKRWQLCKSAFSIVVERSAKFAIHHNAKLRIYIERGDKITDRTIKSYYDEIRSDGMPFAQATSSKYDPITADIFKDTLYEFREQKISLHPFFRWQISFFGRSAWGATMINADHMHACPKTRNFWKARYRPSKFLRWEQNTIASIKNNPAYAGLLQPSYDDLVGYA